VSPIVLDDITTMDVDVIVNAANTSLLGGGGVDGAIHLAAGPELLAECRELEPIETGEVRVTSGYRLPAKWIIHTAGPTWNDTITEIDQNIAKKKLFYCYYDAIMMAKVLGAQSIAFPAISTGIYGFPRDIAAKLAVNAMTAKVLTDGITVYLVAFDMLNSTYYQDAFEAHTLAVV
tara:strand:- start:45 stop:572 length:528 start_codon:yes stop_codon:yes gene_type:complete